MTDDGKGCRTGRRCPSGSSWIYHHFFVYNFQTTGHVAAGQAARSRGLELRGKRSWEGDRAVYTLCVYLSRTGHQNGEQRRLQYNVSKVAPRACLSGPRTDDGLARRPSE